MSLLILILTFVQIVLETLPLSSSAHVIIFKRFYLTFVDSQAFFTKDLYQLANIPTLFVVAWYFRKELWAAMPVEVGTFGRVKLHEQRLQQLIKYLLAAFLACFLTIVCYFATKRLLKGIVVPMELLFALSVTALILGSLYFLPKSMAEKSEIGLTEAVAIGVAQSISLIPGISRFAITYVVARWLRLSHAMSLQFSFLLHSILNSILIAKVLSFNFRDILAIQYQLSHLWLLMVVVIASLISYKLLNLSDKYGANNSLWRFSFYMPVPICAILFLWIVERFWLI